MVSIIIATHGDFSRGILNAVETIMGKQDHCETLTLFHETSVEDFADEMTAKVNDAFEESESVIVFTDLFSATPYNQAAMNGRNKNKEQYRVICGVNLPMLVEAFNQRMLQEGIDTITKKAIEAGENGIDEFFDLMEKMDSEQ